MKHNYSVLSDNPEPEGTELVEKPPLILVVSKIHREDIMPSIGKGKYDFFLKCARLYFLTYIL